MIPPDLNRKELRELAPLNVFGLLDKYDEAHYDRSFRNASVAEQQEVRELQAECASDESLLPSEDPSDALRDKVIGSVMSAVDERHKPVGHIGTNATTVANVASATTVAKGTIATETPANNTKSGGGSEYGLIWRAAAFVLSGAVVVLAYFSIDANQNYKVVTEKVLEGSTYEQVAKELGVDFIEFLGNPNCTARVLDPTVDDGSFNEVFARAYHNEQTDKLYVAIAGLPQNDDYRLVMVHADGRTEEHAINGNNVLVTNVLRTAFDTMALQIINAEGVMVLTA